jgi:hypothetical protein
MTATHVRLPEPVVEALPGTTGVPAGTAGSVEAGR